MRCTNNRTTSEIKRGITPFNYMQGGLMPILGPKLLRYVNLRSLNFTGEVLDLPIDLRMVFTSKTLDLHMVFTSNTDSQHA